MNRRDSNAIQTFFPRSKDLFLKICREQQELLSPTLWLEVLESMIIPVDPEFTRPRDPHSVSARSRKSA